MGADRDSHLTLKCRVCVDLGVDEHIAVPDGLLRSKRAGEEFFEPQDYWPAGADSYASDESADNQQFLVATYTEDVEEGMAAGPYPSDHDLASFLEVPVDYFDFGALAVRGEADGAGGLETKNARCTTGPSSTATSGFEVTFL